MRHLKHKLFSLPFFQDRLVFVSLGLAALLNIIIWAVLLSKFGFDSASAPLHFNVVYGINFVGPAYRIYQLPFVGLAVLVANIFLAKAIYTEYTVFSYFLTFTAAVVQAVLFIAAITLFVIA